MNSNTGKKTGGDEGVLVPSASAVTRFRKPLVDYLISGLEENDKWVRILAIDMLGSAGDPRAVEYLKPLLVDRDRDLRTISAQAMDMIHSQQAVSIPLAAGPLCQLHDTAHCRRSAHASQTAGVNCTSQKGK